MRRAAVAAAAAATILGAAVPAAALKCECVLPDEETWSRYNALLLGDATTMGYAEDVEDIVSQDGLAYVLAAYPNERDTGACATSEGFVACLEPWLARNWSSVSFNWGREDAAAAVDAADYAANMQRAYRLINASTPVVTFATTTPEPPTSAVSNARVKALNEEADALFGENGRFEDVAVNRLYGKVVANCRLAAGSDCYPHACDCPTLQDADGAFTDHGNYLLGVVGASYNDPYRANATLHGASPIHENSSSSSGLPYWVVATLWNCAGMIALGAGVTAALLFWHRGDRVGDDEYVSLTGVDAPAVKTWAAVAAAWALVVVALFVYGIVVYVYQGPQRSGNDNNCPSSCPPFPDGFGTGNVLYVGDSITGQYYSQANELLAHYDLGAGEFVSLGMDGYCGTSYGVLACIDPYLCRCRR